VNLQATHKELECSYERLVESHTMLEVASEVMLNSVKSYESHHHTCTCTQAKFDISCANPCGPKGKTSWYEDVLVESCDELLVQENEDLMHDPWLKPLLDILRQNRHRRRRRRSSALSTTLIG